MITLMQYAYMAMDVYRPMKAGYRCIAPDCFAALNFTHGDKPLAAGGSAFSTGLQARVYFHTKSDVAAIAFKGTEPNYDHTGRRMRTDYEADLFIALPLLIPRQAFAAVHLVRAWRRHLKGYRLRLVGHSLGGGLAQLVGKSEEIPFINFNGPGVWTNSIPFVGRRAFTRTPASMGVNYVTAHVIGRWGVHVGHVVRL